MKSTCEICKSIGEAILTPYVGSRVNSSALGAESIKTCQGCKTARIDPLPSKDLLLSIYESGEYWGEHKPSPAYTAHVSIQCTLRCDRALEHVPTSRQRLAVLDFGAGHGEMAAALGKSGRLVDYHFVEPDRSAAKSIMSHTASSISVTEYDEADQKSFDVIFLNQVMEHVDDPIDLIRNLSFSLKTDGVLYVETPYLDHKFKDEVFPHIYFFNEVSYQYISEHSQLNLKQTVRFGTEAMIKRPFLHRVFALLWLLSFRLHLSTSAKWLYRNLYFEPNDENPIWIYGIFTRPLVTD